MPHLIPDVVSSTERALSSAEQDEFGSFITVAHETAMSDAGRLAATDPAASAALPLYGMAVAVKDNIDTRDLLTTIGSGVYAERIPTSNAKVVSRLKAAGAVVVGKTNLTELACGSVGFNEYFGDVLNPLDPSRYPGGSSSGSAAAVAAGIVPLAIGSDTSCSIRQPAAACGVVGLKATFGRVPTNGTSVCSHHLDHVGPITRDVATAALALAVMQDSAWDDPTAQLNRDVKDLRVGVLRGEFTDACDKDVAREFSGIVGLAQSLGCQVREIDLAIDLGQADEHANALSVDMLGLYGSEVMARRKLAGRELLDWFDLYDVVDTGQYQESLAEQNRLRSRLAGVMSEWDVLVCPTTRVGAGLLASARSEHRGRRMGNCSIWAMAGMPSMSIPFGVADTGMPLGLLINARWGDDATVLQFGAAVARAS